MVQWNPINTVTKWAKTIWPYQRGGRSNKVFLQENIWRFLPGGQKKAVVTR